MKAILTTSIGLMFLIVDSAKSQDSISTSKREALLFEANYTSDFVDNLHGGIKTGTAYLGQINLAFTLNTKDFGMWKGGEFYIQIQNSHGATPSVKLVGDNQKFTNIENGNYTYLYELRYKHDFEKLWINLGIIDLNSEFIVTEEGFSFINSSFGVIPTVSENIPLSIFPKNALGAMLNYSISSKISFQISLLDGDPRNLDEDSYNLKHKISKKEGLYYSGELIVSNQKSKYKLSGYFHSGNFIDVVDSLTIHNHNYGFYAIADQYIYDFSESRKLRGFVQIGYAPMNRNILDFYLGAGFNFYSPFKRKDDVVGIAFAYASLCNDFYRLNSNSYKNYELAIECNYSFSINHHLTIQPNSQYIINPGMSVKLSNSWVTTLRLNFSL